MLACSPFDGLLGIIMDGVRTRTVRLASSLVQLYNVVLSGECHLVFEPPGTKIESCHGKLLEHVSSDCILGEAARLQALVTASSGLLAHEAVCTKVGNDCAAPLGLGLEQ